MKKVLAILLAVVMLAAIAACGSDGDGAGSGTGPATGPGSSPASSPSVLVPGDVIQPPAGPEVQYADTIDIIGDMNIVVVDPHTPGATSAIARGVYGTIYDKLIVRVGDGEFAPSLATSWETTDLQTWRFTLRDDVYFHGDWGKFTAQSVIDTIALAKDAPGSHGFDSWRSVNTITAINDYEIEIVLSAVNADFLFLISLPGASIVSKEAREADPVAGLWVGTGAFYVSNFVSNDHVEVTRFDNYWGEPPLTRRLIFRFVPEIAARTIMLLNGESHACTAISPEDLAMFVASDDFLVYRVVTNSAHSLMFNMNDPITGDLNFRRAVAHALNRTDIAIAAAGDWAMPPLDGAFWGSSTEFRNTDIQMLPFDLTLARQYLDASPYNGEEIELMTGVDTMHRAALLIQEQLVRLGINLVLFQTDAPTLGSLAVYGNDRVQLVHHVSAFNLSAASARGIFYPQGANNRISYNNPAVNQLLDLAPTIADAPARAAIYRQIQELVNEDIPFTNLYDRANAIVVNGAIGGIVVNSDQNHDYRYIFMVVDD